MMTHEDFLTRVKHDLTRRLGEPLGVEIHVRDVQKMNSESYRGIGARKMGCSTEAMLNIDAAFEAYKNGKSYEDIIDLIEDGMRNAIERAPTVDTGCLKDYEAVRNKIAMQLIPKKGNEEMLENMPHMVYEDMACVYRVDLGQGAHAVITNQMLEQYGITAAQLHEDAMDAAPKVRPVAYLKMGDVVGGGREDDLTIVTNEQRIHGAASILYPDVLEQVAERVHGAFYILPSSIHEVIIVPDNGEADAGALVRMVREVNRTVLEPGDKLSDSVYRYEPGDMIFHRVVA